MNKRLLIFGIAVLLTCGGLSGCFESNNENSNDFEKFVATWASATSFDKKIIRFFSNGTGFDDSGSFEWEINDKQLIINWPDKEYTITYDYEFINDKTYGERLILKNVDSGQVDDYQRI